VFVLTLVGNLLAAGCSVSYEEVDFAEAIRRIRSGDDRAAAELVRRYEPLIRREVRLHLEDERLRRVFDSMDVVQSVLASFFVRTAAGEYDLDSPEQLSALLVQMSRNKLASAARKQYQRCRDVRRTEMDDDALSTAAADELTPSAEVAVQEELNALRGQMTSEEREIAMLRADGRSWAEVASALGGTPQARRMQLTRGVERAAKELGLAKLYE
jgi:RNA polymerase sigma-70 factor (ECF subfamily)